MLHKTEEGLYCAAQQNPYGEHAERSFGIIFFIHGDSFEWNV